MKTLLSTVIAAIALFGAAAPAVAELPRVGQTVRGLVEIGNKQVPLAAGDWRVASVYSDSSLNEYGAYGIVESAVLFQSNATGMVTAAVEIFANALPTVDGWGVSKDCDRTGDIHLSVTRYKAGWDALCYFVYNTLSADDGRSASWLQALGFARANRLRAPEQWIVAGVRAANRRDMVDVRYYFSPEAAGFAGSAARNWRESAWSPKNLAADPAKVAYVAAVAQWVNTIDGYYLSGLKNRFDSATVIPLPNRNDRSLPTPESLSIKSERLRALERVREAELIDAEEYARQRKALIDQDPNPGANVVDPATVALYKAVAYRPIVSFANIFIDYFWTGSPFVAGVMLFLQVTINSGKFYVHEMAWETLGINNGVRRDSARTLDFTYVGHSD